MRNAENIRRGFQNQRTGKVDMDKFTGLNEGEARGSFWVCYRHENYTILATVEVPEIKKTEEVVG